MSVPAGYKVLAHFNTHKYAYDILQPRAKYGLLKITVKNFQVSLHLIRERVNHLKQKCAVRLARLSKNNTSPFPRTEKPRRPCIKLVRSTADITHTHTLTPSQRSKYIYGSNFCNIQTVRYPEWRVHVQPRGTADNERNGKMRVLPEHGRGGGSGN